jgi:uncharacterized protein (DUF1697 family)
VTRHIVLLRGINLARRNRIAMPELREALGQDGFRDVRTYVQSGNIIVSSKASPDQVAKRVKAAIKKRFGLDITVLVRSRVDFALVVHHNPLAKIATNPKGYLVTFLSSELPPGSIDDLAEAAKHEPFAVIGREVYSWHPDGIGRTPLWERLASKSPGIAATSRNWTTVTTLLAMADSAIDR